MRSEHEPRNGRTGQGGTLHDHDKIRYVLFVAHDLEALHPTSSATKTRNYEPESADAPREFRYFLAEYRPYPIPTESARETDAETE